MARARQTTTTTTTTTQVDAQRVKSLTTKAGQSLSSLEESVLRMHHGVSVKPMAALASNGTTAALMTDLHEREVDAFLESGMHEHLPDVPAAARKPSSNPRTQSIAAKLKNATKR
jgi:hypothetical protein